MATVWWQVIWLSILSGNPAETLASQDEAVVKRWDWYWLYLTGQVRSVTDVVGYGRSRLRVM